MDRIYPAPITRRPIKGTIIPAALMVDVNPDYFPLSDRQSEMLGWVARHNAAIRGAYGVHMPPTPGKRRNEWRVVTACHAVSQLVRTWDAWADERDPDRDYLMAEEIAPVLRSAIGRAVAFTSAALDYDTGALDCGTISAWLCEIADRVGVDSSTGELVGADPIRGEGMGR